MSQQKISLIAPYLKSMFKDVKLGWQQLILKTDLKDRFKFCMDWLDKTLLQKGVKVVTTDRSCPIRPLPHNILNAFRYFEPTKTRVIIIGQDPYTKVGEAVGLSFSVPCDVRIPPSLRNIYKCLRAQNL